MAWCVCDEGAGTHLAAFPPLPGERGPRFYASARMLMRKRCSGQMMYGRSVRPGTMHVHTCPFSAPTMRAGTWQAFLRCHACVPMPRDLPCMMAAAPSCTPYNPHCIAAFIVKHGRLQDTRTGTSFTMMGNGDGYIVLFTRLRSRRVPPHSE